MLKWREDNKRIICKWFIRWHMRKSSYIGCTIFDFSINWKLNIKVKKVIQHLYPQVTKVVLNSNNNNNNLNNNKRHMIPPSFRVFQRFLSITLTNKLLTNYFNICESSTYILFFVDMSTIAPSCIFMPSFKKFHRSNSLTSV